MLSWSYMNVSQRIHNVKHVNILHLPGFHLLHLLVVALSVETMGKAWVRTEVRILQKEIQRIVGHKVPMLSTEGMTCISYKEQSSYLPGQEFTGIRKTRFLMKSKLCGNWNVLELSILARYRGGWFWFSDNCPKF